MDLKVLRKISYGLYVIGSAREGSLNGQIANTVFQISSEPATLAVGINKSNLTWEFIKSSGIFTVSVLPKSVPLDFIGRFGFKSGRETDKYDGLSYRLGTTGAPILLEQSAGFLEAEVIASQDVNTHTLFIGRVVDAAVLSEEDPMTYAFYHQVKKGSVPPSAPSYIKGENKVDDKPVQERRSNEMKKYECSVCGYVYDPAAGDPDSGVAPGTAFEDIPEDWVCPVCGVGKDQFEPLDE